jgi:hypothetical protein
VLAEGSQDVAIRDSRDCKQSHSVQRYWIVKMLLIAARNIEDLAVEDVVEAMVVEDLTLERGGENSCAAWVHFVPVTVVGPTKP